ncbi:MAG: copper chaperone PCu(A)C [Bacteroidota bacterium]
MLRRSLLLLPALLLAACQTDTPADPSETTEITPPMDASSTPDALSVSDPFTAAVPAQGTGGVFLTLTGGPTPDTLIGASFAGAEQVEVHETYDTEDGLRGMREAEGGIPVPAASTVELAPGGYHIMLINLAEAATEGDTLDLTLEFTQAGPLEVRVPVLGLDQIQRPSAE